MILGALSEHTIQAHHCLVGGLEFASLEQPVHTPGVDSPLEPEGWAAVRCRLSDLILYCCLFVVLKGWSVYVMRTVSASSRLPPLLVYNSLSPSTVLFSFLFLYTSPFFLIFLSSLRQPSWRQIHAQMILRRGIICWRGRWRTCDRI